MYLPPAEIDSEACLKKVIVNRVPSRAVSWSDGYSGAFEGPHPKSDRIDISVIAIGLLFFIVSWGGAAVRPVFRCTDVRPFVYLRMDKDTNLLRNGQIGSFGGATTLLFVGKFCRSGMIYYLCNELMRFFSFPTQYIAGGTVY